MPSSSASNTDSNYKDDIDGVFPFAMVGIGLIVLLAILLAIIIAACLCVQTRRKRLSKRRVTPVAATLVVPSDNSIAKVPLAMETGTRPAPVNAKMIMPPASTTDMATLPVAVAQIV